jgi:hypothetical protein
LTLLGRGRGSRSSLAQFDPRFLDWVHWGMHFSCSLVAGGRGEHYVNRSTGSGLKTTDL